MASFWQTFEKDYKYANVDAKKIVFNNAKPE